MNEIKWDWNANNGDKSFIKFNESETKSIFYSISNIEPEFPHDPEDYKKALNRMKYYAECYMEKEFLILEKEYQSMPIEDLRHKLEVLFFNKMKIIKDYEKQKKKEKVLEKLIKIKDVEFDQLIDFIHQCFWGS